MKRGVDLLVAALALLLLSPLLLAIALFIRCLLGRPILFIQWRAGLAGRQFRLVKFRTMLEAYDPEGQLLPDADRMTRFGRFLRTTSLDELPELWNVLEGEMSLVGPRPLLLDYLPLYTSEQARRHEVRPGITGLAQVSGRNALSWEEKFRLDVWYVDHGSAWLDIKILLLTLIQVFRGVGISQEGQATAQAFQGSGPRGSGH